jgi:diaminopropionate ammonia-lyase
MLSATMIRNGLAEYRSALDPADADALGTGATGDVERFLAHRDDHAPTPLVALPALARQLGVGAIHIKDEGKRLGLGSFKALGGAYAVIRLAVDATAQALGRPADIANWRSPEVARVAADMTFACATDGNHGRSVAQGAQFVGAQCVIFVHVGVS